MRPKEILATARLAVERQGAGFCARSLRDQIGPIDPFIRIDHFHMSEPTFPPHPHAGFSAVTYLFEGSAGAFTNRDSFGDERRLGPGSLQWTEAARGMMHEEVPERPGTDCHGAQILVNLAAVHKNAPPRAMHLPRGDVPEIRADGVRARVLAGESHGVRSPLDPLTKVTLLDVHLAPGARFEHAVAAGHRAFVLVIAGAGRVGVEAGAREVVAGSAAAFGDAGQIAVIGAGREALHVLLGSGRPIGEPVVFQGPFVMTTEAEIADAYRRHEAGEMGRIAPAGAR